ncbi:MAG: elongation factor G [Polyangiaceae bacterium]|nr:elongation factor G [Polyangiaceae bacterium]
MTPDKIRSFTLIGASGSGKTALAEALLYRAGVCHQLGRSASGGSYLDSEPEEEKRSATVLAKVQSLIWDKHRLHFADTPGFADFIGNAIAPLSVLDAAVIVIDASSGVNVATKQLYDLAMQANKPILFFLNKMDRERADFAGTLASIRKNLSKRAFAVTLPVGQGAEFNGVIDIVDSRYLSYESDKIAEGPIPADLQDEYELAHQELVEEVAAGDEALFEKVANGETLRKDDILPQLRDCIRRGEIQPVVVGSAFPPKGTTMLLDTLVHLLPPACALPPPPPAEGEPETLVLGADSPAVAQVFKISSDPGVGDIFFLKVVNGSIQSGDDLVNAHTGDKERVGHPIRIEGREKKDITDATVGDVIAVPKLKASNIGDTLAAGKPVKLAPLRMPNAVHSVAVTPKSRKDQDKMGPAVNKLCFTDPTLHYHIDSEFNETILSGMGEVHLEFVAGRLKERYGVELDWGAPHIRYRETITRKVEAQGRHKKQSGGHGQFGDCWIRVEPLVGSDGFEFVDEIKGGVIPTKWVPSVEAGVKKAMEKGALGGYPVVGVKCAVFDGSYHSVDSSDMAFQIAGSLAFKKAEEKAGAILLEPIMHVEVTASEEYVGPITNDLNQRRGRVSGMDQEGDLHVVRADVPLSELFRYSTDLRSLTQGAGSFKMEFAQYEQVPSHLVEQIVKAAQSDGDKT